MKQYVKENGIIAIVRGLSKDKLIPVAKALYEGGIRMIECTIDHTEENPLNSVQGKIRLLKKEFGDNMMVGAGTVLSEEEVLGVYEAGAQLIVTPTINTAVVKCAKYKGMVTVIGALTPTEAQTAYEAGADFVKIFPAGNLGVDYFKSIKAPLAHIPMMAVGGVSIADIETFMKAGAVGFGIGSPLIPKADVENGNYDHIKEIAKEYTSLYKEHNK